MTVAIGSRTLESRIDDECREVEFNIWRKRLMYGWHLENVTAADMFDTNL